MLKVTLDTFSGRTNPSWVMPAAPALRLLRGLAGELGFVVSPDAVPAVLGYRGVNLQILSPDLRLRFNLPPWLGLVPGRGAALARHVEQVTELLWLAAKRGIAAEGRDLADLLRTMERFLTDLIGSGSGSGIGTPPAPSAPAGPCPFEMLPYDPGFWNDPGHIKHNNCYAYATNQRTDTFPQPGRGSGKEITAMTCAAAVAASLADGAHAVNDCFGDGERPRLLVALVIWPGQDYHWYRKHPDFWGHKPGETPARNVDSSKKIILDPEKCDRGPYSDFCGYFLIPKSQKVA
jgi:hypothetical protein